MSRLVVGAVALLLALTACGGDPKPDPSPSVSTSVTSPASATPTPPVMPEEAKADTKAGAIAFVKYYIALINHAQATGDVDALAKVEGPDCKSCAEGRDYLKKIYGSGGHISGGAWSVHRVKARQSGENWAVTVTGAFAPSDAYASADADPQHAKGGPTLTNFIVWHDTAWRVRSWFSG